MPDGVKEHLDFENIARAFNLPDAATDGEPVPRRQLLALLAGLSGGSATDHGSLIGLTDDDHPQYHTDARADARYTTGPGSATNNSLARFDGASGKLLKDGAVIGADVQAYSAVLQATTASFTTALLAKIGYIVVTQPVDLDAIETRVNALDAAVVLKGGWDASAGTFPGGGAAQAGDSYIVTVAGTVGGVEFAVNDRLLAIVDNASTTTYAPNWLKLDYTDQVLSVAGRTGAVTLVMADLTDSTAAGRALLDDVDAAAQRATLGLGSLATQSGTFSGSSSGTNTGDQTITLTGDVTGGGTGSFVATIANNAVGNTKLADMAANTLKGNNTGVSADPADLTAAQVRSLINVADGATANSSDATLLARTNHTGTQVASTISNFDAAADARVSTGIAAHEAAGDPHPQYLTAAEGAAAYAAAGHSHSGLAPTGGTVGQVLKKIDGTDYNYSWQADASGSGIVTGTATLAVAVGADFRGSYEDRETVIDAAVSGASRITLSLAPHLDTDENDPEMLSIASMVAIPGSGAFDVIITFPEPTSGPIKINYWVA